MEIMDSNTYVLSVKMDSIHLHLNAYPAILEQNALLAQMEKHAQAALALIT